MHFENRLIGTAILEDIWDSGGLGHQPGNVLRIDLLGVARATSASGLCPVRNPG
jgi:hypothetical protein